MLIVTREVLVQAPVEAVSAYLHDITHLSDYEQKVGDCKVSYPDKETALASVNGTYMGLAWKAVFEMKWTSDGGFKSKMIRGPLKDMTGGFHLRQTPEGVVVTHFERYGFPWFIRPLYVVIRPWLARSMEIELDVIKRGVERPTAHA